MMNKIIKFTIVAPLTLVALFGIGLSASEASEHVYTSCYERSCKAFSDAIEEGSCQSGENGCAPMAIALLACERTCASKQKKANLCKVKIKVTNNSNRQIRTVRVGVYDIRAKKWRLENIRNKTLRPGRSYSERANLPGIKGQRFKMNLHYKKRKGKFFKWGIKTVKSPIKTMPRCRSGGVYRILIN